MDDASVAVVAPGSFRPAKPGLTVLLGLPSTEADFLARLEAPREAASDFLGKFDGGDLEGEAREALHRHWWRGQYDAIVAAPLRRIARQAEALGFSVRENACLADLKDCDPDGVVVVISHWKGAEFSNDDFGSDFDARLGPCLAHDDHPLAQAIREAMTPAPRRWPAARPRPQGPRAAVRKSLDAQVEDHGLGAGHQELATTRRFRRRAWLDRRLAGLVRPGLRLELNDGLHDADSIYRALPEGFSGVIDLVVCTSTYLGDRLGALSRQRIRTVQFLEPQSFEEAAIRLGYVLDVYAATTSSYLETRAVVAKAYDQALRDTRARRRWGRTR